MITPRDLKGLYEQGRNKSELLRKEWGGNKNTEHIIEVSYDLQDGSYIAALKDEAIAKYVENYTEEISNRIKTLCNLRIVLEAGVGEMTTLAGVAKNPGVSVDEYYGFDLSWSRIAIGKRWLSQTLGINPTLCTGSLFNIPFSNDSIALILVM